MAPTRNLSAVLLCLALAVLAILSLGSVRYAVQRVREWRTQRLYGAAEVLASSLSDLDPYFVDPEEVDQALLKLRRFAGPLGVTEVSLIEVGDRVVVSTSPGTSSGTQDAAAIAAPQAVARAWAGKPALSRPIRSPAGVVQALFYPLHDDNGEVASLLVALAGHDDTASLDQVLGTFRAVIVGASVLVGLLLLTALAVSRRAEKAEGDLEHARRLGLAGQVAAGVVHEVRNPLGVMRSSLEYLRDRTDTAPEDREVFDDALEEADRISETLERFLALARNTPCEPSPVVVAEELAGVARLVDRDLVRRGIPLEVLAPSPSLTALCDPRSLRQALLNLVLNARASLEAGGNPEGGMTLSAHRDHGQARIVIEVTDCGPGFSAQILAEPFRAFRTEKPEGTGLGLALVLRFAQASGGDATLENLPTGGARVRLFLPMVHAEDRDG